MWGWYKDTTGRDYRIFQSGSAFGSFYQMFSGLQNRKESSAENIEQKSRFEVVHKFSSDSRK